jgi:hypothetical protein
MAVPDMALAVVDINARQNGAKGNGSNITCPVLSLSRNEGDLTVGTAHAKSARRRRGKDNSRIVANS